MNPSAEVLPNATERSERVGNAGNAIAQGALALCAACVGFAVSQHGGEYTPIAIKLITCAIFCAIVSLAFSWSAKLLPNRRGLRIQFLSAATLAFPLLALFLLWNAGGPQSTAYKVAIGIGAFVLVRILIAVKDYAHSARQTPWIWWVDFVLCAGITLQFYALFIRWPVGVDQTENFRNGHSHFVYLYLTGASAFLVLLGFLNIPSLRRWWFPAVLIVHAVLGIWTIRASQFPHIDVWYFQEIAPNALLSGHNPYDYTQVHFEDIYDSTLPGHQPVYGKGMVENGHLKFGFPYPPISLFCSTIGILVGNDTRYAQAMALTLAGLLIGYARPGRVPKLAAILLLFTPTVWFVIARAWTEPFVILFLAATVFCAARKLRWLLHIAFGLFLCSKQYLIFVVPLSFLLIADFDWRSKESWREWLTLLLGAAIVASLVTLPLAVWNLQAFWFSTVTVQKDAPFRWDALSYLVWAGFNFDTKYTAWVWLAFVGAALAMLLSIWKARRSAAGFASAIVLTYLLFIAFNKQAFCNYYFFVIGCICCALATADTGPHFAGATSSGDMLADTTDPLDQTSAAIDRD